MRLVLLLGPALALSACANPYPSIVYHNYYSSGYSPSHVELAAASGPALAVIRNDPFPTDRNNEGVVAAMQGRNYGPKIYFTQTPRPDDKYGYKVVMNFGAEEAGSTYAPISNGAYNICQTESTGSSVVPATGDVMVSAAFCVGDRLLTDATASIGGASGPDDPRFQRFIGDVMVALTPIYIPHGGHKCTLNC